MQSALSEYQISIGEFGEWTEKLTEEQIQAVKVQVRQAVRRKFATLSIPWALDLNTLSMLNGKIPSSQFHTTIPEKVHRQALQCWLESINPLLPPKQRLWIPDASSFAYLCCAYRHGEWHACGTLELHQGADAKSARPWVVPALLKVDGANKKVPVPIRLEASWTCMAEDEHGPHAAAGPKPVRTGKPAPLR